MHVEFNIPRGWDMDVLERRAALGTAPYWRCTLIDREGNRVVEPGKTPHEAANNACALARRQDAESEGAR